MLITLFKMMIEQGEEKESLLEMISEWKELSDSHPEMNILSLEEYETILNLINLNN